MARRLGKKRASAYLAFHRAEYNFVWFSSLPHGGTGAPARGPRFFLLVEYSQMRRVAVY